MAPIYPDEDLPDAEETYHESSDEDFNPTAVPADESSSSSDEDASIAKPSQRKRKPKAAALDDFDSGDEATIEAARKRKAKKKKGAKADDEEENELLLSDEGGEGGLIKTRAQRKVEQKERRPLARTEGATVDVDALWAQMNAAPLRPVQAVPTPQITDPNASKSDHDMGGEAAPLVLEEEEMVSVKKTYTFAGQETTEEKEVPRSSLEKYLSEGWKTAETATEQPTDAPSTESQNPQTKIRRPLRRPSRFDPNPTGYVRTLPPEHQLTWPRTTTPTTQVEQENMAAPDAPRIARPEKAHKLNVVDKSRLDWTGFVDKEGIAEELNTHGKTKEAYLGRMEFLAGVEARREEGRMMVKSANANANGKK